MLDTNVVVVILRGRPTVVRERLRAVIAGGGRVDISAVVLFELTYGAAKSSRPGENAERIRAFLAGGIGTVPFTDDDAWVAGEVRARLEAIGRSIGPFDLLIAGQALRRGATLVTGNATEMARVPGLRWEDWTADRREPPVDGRRARR